MENPTLKEILNEYKKLPESKNALENYIGSCGLRIRENEIKKNEIEKYMNKIKELYLKKIDDPSQNLDGIINDLNTRKEVIENRIASIPNGFNNIINNNDYAQGNIVYNELKKLNQINPNIKNIILEKLKINPKLFIENYESDFCEFNIPFSGQCNDGYEIVNTSLNFIPQFPTKLVLKYLQNKLVICFTIDINLPLNSPKYPRFYVYLTMKNQKYGLEYIELSNQSFPQDLVQKGQVNNAGLLKQQINTNELDLTQFFFLAGDEKKIRIKIYVTKIYYEN